MRQMHGTTYRFAAISLLVSLLAASPFAGEPASGRNPALPRLDDLIAFDASLPAPPMVPDGLAEVNQRAFPIYYGVIPPTVDAAPPPASGRAPRMEPLHSSAPLGPDAPYSRLEATGPVATVTSSGEGFVDYQAYLRKQDGTEAPGPEPLSRPQPRPDAPARAPAPTPAPAPEPALTERAPDFGGPDMPVPLPPPAEVLAMAAAERGDAGDLVPGAAVATPAARPVPEPPPLLGGLNDHPARAAASPPPLPELPAAGRSATGDGGIDAAGTAAPAVTPAAIPASRPVPDLEQVRAEFNSLKSYCESDSLGSAAEIYAQMPDFDQDEEINRLRADAANLLILGLARTGNLMAARRVYDSVPVDMPGFDARLAKARAVINLTTYYIRADRFTDAFTVLMDVGKIQNRSALNNELFRLMARMIPYLDNAEETDKARRIYDLLLGEVKSPGTAALFSENVRASVLGYYLPYVDKSDSPIHRRARLDFLEHIFDSLERLENNPDIHSLRKYLGDALMERYAGDPDRAALFHIED